MEPRRDEVFILRDGRRLAFAEWGEAEGRPLFFFHGTPNGRLFHHPDPEALTRLGLRLISVDRPGYGGSDARPGRRVVDWAADVRELADHLALGPFAVMGLSGGGPHALACAYALADQVTRTAVVSGLVISQSDAWESTSRAGRRARGNSGARCPAAPSRAPAAGAGPHRGG